MSERAGVVAHRNLTAQGHEAAISPHTRSVIDSEVRRLTDQVHCQRGSAHCSVPSGGRHSRPRCGVTCVRQAYANAKKLLSEHEEELHVLAKELIDKETLGGDELRRLLKNPIQPEAEKESAQSK